MPAIQALNQDWSTTFEPRAVDTCDGDGRKLQPLAGKLKDQNLNEVDQLTEAESHDQQNTDSIFDGWARLKSFTDKMSLADRQVNPEAEHEIKCSAVHSLERDMPDFDYSHLVRELRDRILTECQLNEGLYAKKDIEKCKHDQWFVERFLLRQKLDLDKAFDMLKRTMRFKNESLAHSIRREDWPAEFYQVGGLFAYEEDRKGNKMLYIRLKIHRKIPEIQLVLQAFLFHNIDYLDELANGKGKWSTGRTNFVRLVNFNAASTCQLA